MRTERSISPAHSASESLHSECKIHKSTRPTGLTAAGKKIDDSLTPLQKSQRDGIFSCQQPNKSAANYSVSDQLLKHQKIVWSRLVLTRMEVSAAFQDLRRVEALNNLIFLASRDAGNPENVRSYLTLPVRQVATLTAILKRMSL